MNRIGLILSQVFLPILLMGQILEVDGKIEVSEMDTVLTQGTVVVRQTNGILAESEIQEMMIRYFLSLPDGIQVLLDAGETPLNILSAGASIADFYGRQYQGGLIFYLTAGGEGLVKAP